MTGVRAYVLRLPLVRLRGEIPCGAARVEGEPIIDRFDRCGQGEAAGLHVPVAECYGYGLDGTGCPNPAAHHAYRPLPWWRRVRRERWSDQW